jgi:hypothetical protein
LVAVAAAISALAFVLTAWGAAGTLGLPLDDSWIHLHFARSLAEGDGLAFERGRLVAGSTAPLWTSLLAVMEPLPGSAVVWTQLLGALLFVLCAPLFYGLGRDLGLNRRLAIFAACLMVASGPLAWAAVSGLEIPLFILLSLAATRVHLRDRRETRGLALSLPLFALSALARPEGLLLLALALLDRGLAAGGWRRWLGGAWRGLLLATLVIAPVALFNLAVSGTLSPTTFVAKSGGVRSLWPSLRYLHTVLGIFFRSQPYMTLLAGAGIVTLVRRLGTAEDRGLLPAMWVVGLPLAYSCLGSSGGALVGNFGRYHYPLLPFIVLLGGLGVRPLIDRGRSVSSKRGRLVLVATALLIAYPTVGHWRTTAGQFARSVRNVEEGDAAAARWLRDRLPAGSTLAVNDIGVVKYLLPEREMYDLAGIVTPEVHDFTRAAVAQGRPWEEGVARFLESVRPDFLVVFPDWFPRLLSSEVSFEPIKEFVVVGNITLGGDRLVIYTTPWTRRPLEP